MSLGATVKPAGTSAHCPFGEPVMSSGMSGYLNLCREPLVSVIQRKIRIKEPADLGYLKKLKEPAVP
jgi:hypothetical protein